MKRIIVLLCLLSFTSLAFGGNFFKDLRKEYKRHRRKRTESDRRQQQQQEEQKVVDTPKEQTDTQALETKSVKKHSDILEIGKLFGLKDKHADIITSSAGILKSRVSCC